MPFSRGSRYAVGPHSRVRFGLRSRVRFGLRSWVKVFAVSIITVVASIAIEPLSVQTSARQGQWKPAPATFPAPQPVLDKYCITCHNQKLRTAGLALDTLDITDPSAHAEVWEKVIANLRAGAMPPPGRPRPDAATYHAVARFLEAEIDRAWAASPNPGRISAVHRLNRA